MAVVRRFSPPNPTGYKALNSWRTALKLMARRFRTHPGGSRRYLSQIARPFQQGYYVGGGTLRKEHGNHHQALSLCSGPPASTELVRHRPPKRSAQETAILARKIGGAAQNPSASLDGKTHSAAVHNLVAGTIRTNLWQSAQGRAPRVPVILLPTIRKAAQDRGSDGRRGRLTRFSSIRRVFRGIHMRFGKVAARGRACLGLEPAAGISSARDPSGWSRAQGRVKGNAVIVRVGGPTNRRLVPQTPCRPPSNLDGLDGGRHCGKNLPHLHSLR